MLIRSTNTIDTEGWSRNRKLVLLASRGSNRFAFRCHFFGIVPDEAQQSRLISNGEIIWTQGP